VLLARWQQAEWWLAVPGLEEAEGFAHGVGHGRKEEAGVKVPAWLVNMAQHSVAGTDFPDELACLGLSGSGSLAGQTLSGSDTPTSRTRAGWGDDGRV
jgi:hypothetical protein